MTRIVWFMSLILTTLAIILIPFGRNSQPVRILVTALVIFGWTTAIITIVLLFGGTYYL
jgi:hypothetical protein